MDCPSTDYRYRQDCVLSHQDKAFMAEAVHLAELAQKHGQAQTWPNPCVGAVLVKNGKVIGRGVHLKAGQDHAEVQAIKAWKPHLFPIEASDDEALDPKKKEYPLEDSAADKEQVVLYITLQPCHHWGKTPPCTQAIVKAGIQRVVFGAYDTHTIIGNKAGLDFLHKHHISVYGGLLERECRDINPYYHFFMDHQRPFIQAKMAMSLDGKIALKNRQSQWISGSTARAQVQQLRAQQQAIIVGVGTVIQDNPALTVRDFPVPYQPIPVILDPQQKLSAHLDKNFTLLRERSASTVILVAQAIEKHYQEQLNQYGFQGEIISLAHWQEQEFFQWCQSRSIYTCLIEGGAHTLGWFWENNLIDRLTLYIAPIVIGEQGVSLMQGPQVQDLNTLSRDFQWVNCEKIGQDIQLILQRKSKTKPSSDTI